MSDKCGKCYDLGYTYAGCCGGRECGCGGRPIDIEPCKDCNADESKSVDHMEADMRASDPLFATFLFGDEKQ